MEQDLIGRIRERAYEIWAERGGEAEQNWLAAEREILAASLRPSPAAPVRKSKMRPTSKRSKTPIG